MIAKIFFCYWQLCLLRESPENTPFSYSLMLLSACSFIIVIMLQWYVADVQLDNSLVMNLLMAVSLTSSFAAYTIIILAIKQLSARLVQTLSCLLLSQTIIHCFAIPLFLLDPLLIQANEKKPFLLLISVIYLFITIGLTAWQFIVYAHIYKHALNTTPVQAVLMAFGLMAVNILTISLWQ